GRRVVNTAVAINRRLNCNDVNLVFRTMGKVLGKCFVGDTLVLIGEFELGQTVALIDPELSSTAPPLITTEATIAEDDSSRWAWATMFLVVGVTGAILSRDRRRATVPALRLPKRRVTLDPVDDPLPPPLTPEELTALCDELCCPTSQPQSGLPQSSRHAPSDESRTSNDFSVRDEPIKVIGSSRTTSATLALAENPIMRNEQHQLEQPTSAPRRSRAKNVFAVVWVTFFGLLAGWSLFGTSTPPVTKHVTARPVIAATTETPPALFQVNAEPKPRFASKSIRDIHPIADRVIANNPEQKLDDNNATEMELADLWATELADLEAELMELADNEPLPALIDGIPDDAELVSLNDDKDEATESEPTKAETLAKELLQAAQASGREIEWTDYGPFVREHWRVIHFLLTRPDGDLVRIWLARPTWWLEAEQVKTGGKYEFDMEEVGAVGIADVLSIDECQQPPRRQNEYHRLVTGKFEHEATNVIDLYVEGQDEPIGTTANHPFWSEDRQAFVEAQSLRPGENLLNAEGQRIRVITHSARPGPATVYNLEVDGANVYHVSDDGLLVHNACKDVLLGQTMTRVIGLAAQRGWRWLSGRNWNWKRNRDFLYHAMDNVRKGNARILDIGFDAAKGFKAGSITLREMQLLVRNGFRRRWTKEFVNVNGKQVRLFEWVPKVLR
ncbi:MAG: polymorphic toxin-type HINT domain-containing protein, partial [Planctomycetaceae bacterium]